MKIKGNRKLISFKDFMRLRITVLIIIACLLIISIETTYLKNNTFLRNKFKTNSNTVNKYFIKTQPKMSNPMEFAVSAEPLIAYDAYPGIQRHTLDLVYNEFMPGADIAQIEVGIGKMLPGNLPITAVMPVLLSAKAGKIKSENNQEWRFNRKD